VSDSKGITVPGPGDALLVVDVQNDFLPGGALGIAQGDRVVPPLNRMLRIWRHHGWPVYLSRDWHPPGHCSFAEQGGPWPVHCVAGSSGAEFAPGLDRAPGDVVVSKATRVDRDAYSALDRTGLADQWRAAGVRRVFIGGLATDYCVRATGSDARAAGLDVVVLTDAVCAVDVQPDDGDRALADLAAAGCSLTTTDAVLAGMEAPA
jgi:nicotinamidase/pyrazinamidase